MVNFVLDNDQVEQILKSQLRNFNSFFKTLKYLYKSKPSEGLKNLFSKNMLKDPSIIKSMLWELSKYFIIANELINIRKKLFNMIFNKYARDLDVQELERIITNPSNQWLDYNYIKLDLLSSFLDELLTDAKVCQKICKITNLSEKDYYLKRDMVIKQFDRLKAEAFKEFEREEHSKLERRRRRLTGVEGEKRNNEASESKILYENSYDNTFLLVKVEQEENSNV